MEVKAFKTPGEYVAHKVSARNMRGEYYKGYFSVWFNINGTVHDIEWFPRGASGPSRKPTPAMAEQVEFDMGLVMRRADILAE